MPFIHPILFWLGLGAISIPVAIHILNRRRYKIVDFAAMQFLLEALRKNRRRLQLEEWILLALRCLIVLLLGLALARFTGCDAIDALPVGSASQATIYVLDDSYSMGQTRAGSAALLAAKNDLRERIESLDAAEQASVILTSQPDEPIVPLGPIADKQAVLARLETIQPSDRRTDQAEVLTALARKLGDLPGPKRVVLMSDFRSDDLANAAPAWKKALAALTAAQADLLAMDYGTDPRDNLTIKSFALADPYALLGREVRLALEVRNNSPTAATDIPIALTVTLDRNGQVTTLDLPTARIAEIPPGQVARIEIPYTPSQAGSAVLTAALPADELPGDNTAPLSIDVRRAIRVLMIDGAPGPTLAQSASYFLRHALEPTGQVAHGFDVTVIAPGDIPTARFDEYDMVYLLDLSAFPLLPTERDDGSVENYPDLARLERYVAAGGGVGIFTGPKLNTEFYNGRFYNNGAGLNPLPIRPPAGDPAKRESHVQIDPASIRPGGVMSFFAGPAAAATQLIRFWAFTPADNTALPARASQELPVVQARFNDPGHHPAVVSRAFGAGKVVMIYSTASLRWNDWAIDAVDDLTGLYVLFMADLTERLARPQTGQATAPAGTDIRQPVGPELRDSRALLKAPRAGAEPVALRPAKTPAGWVVIHPAPQQVGTYRMTFTLPDESTRTVLLARQAEPDEGKLTPGRAHALAQATGRDDIPYLDRTTGQQARIQQSARSEYWPWLLTAALAALALETTLARKFGHWT